MRVRRSCYQCTFKADANSKEGFEVGPCIAEQFIVCPDGKPSAIRLRNCQLRAAAVINVSVAADNDELRWRGCDATQSQFVLNGSLIVGDISDPVLDLPDGMVCRS